MSPCIVCGWNFAPNSLCSNCREVQARLDQYLLSAKGQEFVHAALLRARMRARKGNA